MSVRGTPQRQVDDAEGRRVARQRAHRAPPDPIPGMRRSLCGATARDRVKCAANISSTSRCMTLWHSHAAAASRAGSISIRPRRSDLIAPLARSLRISSVTVVRRTPSICESACWVSGSTSWSTRSRSLEQPAGHPRFDRVKRVAGRAELKLLQHRPDVNLDRVPYRRTLVESGVKSRCRYPGGGAGRTNNRGIVCRRRPEHRKNTYRPIAPDCGDGNCLPVRHLDHQRDGAAMREEDVLDRVARLRDDRVLIERDHLELGPQQIKIRCR